MYVAMEGAMEEGSVKAANKFATMQHRNTDKTTLVLAYAVLEWALVVLLIVNSLFSYLILRFADYFGLQRPCPWCSRLDHVFDSRGHHFRDLVCHRHAAEISRLGFCSSHGRLAELADLCEDCLSSPSLDENGRGSDPRGNGELNSLKCSCCGVSMERELLCCPTQDDHNPSCIQKRVCITNQGRSDVLLGNHMEDDLGDEEFGEFKAAESCVRERAITEEDENVVLVMEKKEGDNFGVLEVGKDSSTSDQAFLLQRDSRKEESVEVSSGRHLEFFMGNDCELIPVDWTESINVWSCLRLSPIMEEDQDSGSGYEDVIMDFCPPSMRKPDLGMEDFSSVNDSKAVKQVEILENVMEEAEGNSAKEGDGPHACAQNVNKMEESLFPQGDRRSPDDFQVEEDFASKNDEGEEEFPEIPRQEHSDIDEIHCREGDHNTQHARNYNNHDLGHSGEEALISRANWIEISKEALNHQFDLCRKGGQDSFTSPDFLQNKDFNSHGVDIAQSEETSEFRAISNEMSADASNHQLYAELNENEDERIPDTTTAMDSLHQLHRRLLLVEKQDSGSTEESLDGSLMGEIEGDEGTLTIETLKLALRAERKTLLALYTELEEERSASAVAASQTMAMINRLQEEKAAMQMEALQYQRMMEGQSEYDQEALQLLNDLMVKREKENQELEKELELYRKKVEEYEAKENKKAVMVFPGDSKDSSDSCSNEGESDGSIDLNEEAKGLDAVNAHGNTPSEAVLYLEDSLANFEEERALILKQLRNLEDNIWHVNGEWHYKENGNGHVRTCDLDGEVNGSGNGYCKMNGNRHYYQQVRFVGPNAKRLLPLFDAIGEEMDGHRLQKAPEDHFNIEDDKIAIIEEEVDHIYERLQVLEADGEFLKHCFGSLRKGHNGLKLLMEILQLLRDLRSAELHGATQISGDNFKQY